MFIPHYVSCAVLPSGSVYRTLFCTQSFLKMVSNGSVFAQSVVNSSVYASYLKNSNMLFSCFFSNKINQIVWVWGLAWHRFALNATQKTLVLDIVQFLKKNLEKTHRIPVFNQNGQKWSFLEVFLHFFRNCSLWKDMFAA